MLTFITWNANPEIFSVGFLHIRYYGVLFAVAFMASYLIFARFFKRDKLPQPLLDSLTVWAIVSTIVGLRLGHCLFYQPDYYLSHLLEMLKVWEGGLASHGAAIGVPLGLYLFCRRRRMSYLWLLDRIVIVVALVGFFIRTGNLMNSEIFGTSTTLPWGFVFKRHMAELVARYGGGYGVELASHPTQIYEALAYLLIFFVLLHIFVRIERLRSRKGFLFGAFLVLVFTFRFFVEFIKERQVAFEEGMALDMGQLLSIPFVLVGVALIAYSLRHPASTSVFTRKA